MTDKAQLTPKQFFQNTMLFELCLALIGIGICYALGYVPPIYSGSVAVTAMLAIGGALGMFVAMQLITNCHGWVKAQSLEIYKKVGPMFSKLATYQIILIAIAAGVCEELLFRAGLQEALAIKLQPMWAIIIASLVFGLVHALTPLYFVLATIMGLTLGVGYHYSQDLIGVMLWHAIYDIIAIYLIARRPDLIGLATKN